DDLFGAGGITGIGATGGGIANAGTLTLDSCTISANSVINSQTQTGDGGGLYNTGNATLTNSHIKRNLAGANTTGIGAGIENAGATAVLTMIGCTVDQNSAGTAGGIDNLGTATLTNCTLDGNHAVQEAGGVFSNGILTLIACTVTANGAGTGGG